MGVFAAFAVGGWLLLTPLLLIFFSIIFMASFGKSLGVRRLYVALLLRVFEYGRQNIESAKNQTRINFNISGSSESGFYDSPSTASTSTATNGNAVTTTAAGAPSASPNSPTAATLAAIGHHNRSLSVPCMPTAATVALINGQPQLLQQQQHHRPHHHHHQHSYSNGGNTVITRDALILVPEGEMNGGDHHSNHAHPAHELKETHNGSGDGNTNSNNSSANASSKDATRPGDLPLLQSQRSAPLLNSPAGATTLDEPEQQHFEFHLANCLDYVKAGVEAIIEDDVTSRFEAEELKNWNLLTRTNRYYEFISWRLSIIWVCGFVVRYAVLAPTRVMTCFLGVLWLTFCTALVGFIPEGATKRWVVQKVSIQCFGLLGSALSSVVNYHNPENRPGASGICVANHTSPIDVLMLMQDNSYSLIGQSHGGLLGVLQRALARASPHIWFERAESKDRLTVAQRLRTHVSDPTNPPILIFPEGTCINNTSVMQFKKGSFEVGGVIYPVAIKYDPRFGDPFWNSSRYSMVQHLLLMMTSWAIVCDVWYLPPMYRGEDESAIVFANRVKSVIARQGGLIDLVWDGNLKRNKPKEEWKEKQQEEFTKRLKAD